MTDKEKIRKEIEKRLEVLQYQVHRKDVYKELKDVLTYIDSLQEESIFFELGLKARTNKELVEEVYSHIDSINDTADRMTSGNFMHNRAAIKFSANTIAKVLELIGFKTQKGE